MFVAIIGQKYGFLAQTFWGEFFLSKSVFGYFKTKKEKKKVPIATKLEIMVPQKKNGVRILQTLYRCNIVRFAPIQNNMQFALNIHKKSQNLMEKKKLKNIVVNVKRGRFKEKLFTTSKKNIFLTVSLRLFNR